MDKYFIGGIGFPEEHPTIVEAKKRIATGDKRALEDIAQEVIYEWADENLIHTYEKPDDRS